MPEVWSHYHKFVVKTHVQRLSTARATLSLVSLVIAPINLTSGCWRFCGTRFRPDLPKGPGRERKGKEPKDTLRSIAHDGGEGTM